MPSLSLVSTLSPPVIHIGNDKNFALSYDAPVWHCSYSQNGSMLAACYGAPDFCVRIWKCRRQPSITDHEDQWTLVATLSGVHTRTVRCVEFAPSSRVLASASFDGTVAIWENVAAVDDDTGGESSSIWECTAQLEGHDNEVKCVTWNSTGSLLATCGRDKSVWIWECLLPVAAGAVASAPDSFSDGEFDCIAVLHGHSGDVKCVRFAPSHDQWGDGDEILLSASYDDTIVCWAEDAGDWYCAATLTAQNSTIWSIAVAPSGVRLISCADDGSVALWKCYTAKEKASLFPEEGGSKANGYWKCVGMLPNAHDDTVYSVSCASSRVGHGRIASAGGDDAINIYREVGGTSDQPLFALDAFVSNAHVGDVHSIVWHPTDGKELATAGGDGKIKIWRYQL